MTLVSEAFCYICLIFNYVNVYAPVCCCIHVTVDAQGGQRRMFGPL